EVATGAPEQRVRGDMHDDVEVTARPAISPRTSAALETDALRVVDAGWDAHLHLSRPVLDTSAAARRTRLVDHGTTSRTRRARLAEREEPLVFVKDAAAVALRARVRCSAGFGAGSVTRVACDVAREVDRRRDTVDGILERQVQLRFEVEPSLRAGPA